jgi:hypothetical protein
MQFFYWDELPEQDESDIIGGSNDPLFFMLHIITLITIVTIATAMIVLYVYNPHK